MALQIKISTQTAEGFSAAKAFIFLDIFLLRNTAYCNLTYYSSKANFKNGKNAYLPEGLPTQTQLKINDATFWGTTLITDIHNAVKSVLEQKVGSGNVETIQDPNS